MSDRFVVNGEPVAPRHTDDWASIRAWRRKQRARLLARRQTLSCCARREVGSKIIAYLTKEGLSLQGERIGFYWPINGEVDLRPLIRELLKSGADAALPVVVTRNQPLEFWQWNPRRKLCSRGLWNIPAPAERVLVVPTILLVPLLGFDGRCHRLGNGGGYYDRTLAVLDPKPVTIGVGYAFSELTDICPQPHDVAMDRVVTETGWFAGNP